MAPQQDETNLTQALRHSWDLDPTHSSMEFSIKHLMFSKVRGRFRSFTTRLDLDEEEPGRSAVEVTIDVASIDTGTADRDAHLRSPDFFDAESYPTMTFRSTRIQVQGEDEAEVTGDLTVRDITREITLKLNRDGIGQDPWGNTRASYSGQATIDREAFGLTWNQMLEAGGVLVGAKANVEVQIQVVRRADS